MMTSRNSRGTRSRCARCCPGCVHTSLKGLSPFSLREQQRLAPDDRPQHCVYLPQQTRCRRRKANPLRGRETCKHHLDR